MKEQIMPFHKYMSWRCRGCGMWQGHQNNKWMQDMTFKQRHTAIHNLKLGCVMCRRTTKFKDQVHGGLRVSYNWHDHPMMMSKKVGELNDKRLQKSNQRKLF